MKATHKQKKLPHQVEATGYGGEFEVGHRSGFLTSSTLSYVPPSGCWLPKWCSFFLEVSSTVMTHSSSSTLEISTNHKGLLQHPEQSWYCQSAAVFLLFSLAGKIWAPQVSKGCLLDYSPAWRHWPASRNGSEVVRTIAQVVGHFSIIHKHWVRSPTLHVPGKVPAVMR